MPPEDVPKPKQPQLHSPNHQCTCIHLRIDHHRLTGRCMVPNCATRCPRFELGVHVKPPDPQEGPT